MSNFSNFGSLKSTETQDNSGIILFLLNFSNFGSLKSTETFFHNYDFQRLYDFSNFGSLKSTETEVREGRYGRGALFQQFRLVEEH